MPLLDTATANKLLSRRKNVDAMDPRARIIQYKFEGKNSRWLTIANDDWSHGITVYINRQSQMFDWFPVANSAEYFEGVEVGFRYLKGWQGKPKLDGKRQPGISSGTAKLRTLNPAENHVLLLHCASEIGLDKLARWYAGEFLLSVGTAPTRDEVSGDGPYMPLSLSGLHPLQ